MKKKYLLFIFLISTVVVGQNGLINTNWYLQHITVNGVQFDNYFISDIEALKIQINFTESEINGNATCNSYIFSYLIENTNEVKITSSGITLMGCIGIPAFYEGNIMGIVANGFSYSISGSGNDETLTLTNAYGNQAVYSKTPPTLTLFKTWYLESIETNAGVVTIPNTDAPTINLTTDFHDLYHKSLLSGFDGCHNFTGLYNMYVSNQNAFNMFQYNGVSGSCGNTYSNLYVSILSNTTTTFDYSISNEGQTLVLTNNLGEKLVFSDKLLSTEEYQIENDIYLSINPVSTHIDILRSESKDTPIYYTVFSMEGKTVDKGELQNNSIAIENLHSGLYFLKLLSYDYKEVKTLKFIKE